MMPRQAWLPSAMGEGAPVHLWCRGELCDDTQAMTVLDNLYAALVLTAGQQDTAACSDS